VYQGYYIFIIIKERQKVGFNVVALLSRKLSHQQFHEPWNSFKTPPSGDALPYYTLVIDS